MGEEILDFGPVKDTMQGIIKVIGVGGGGCNAVRNMYNEGVEGVTYAVCNTDSQSLSRSPVPVKIMLGESGLGAGANPELGKKEAEANINDIMKLLSDGTKMVFVTAGMGGGTGTGAAPVVAGVAKEMGLLTVGVVTIPFYFEKKRKIIKALKGVDELRKNVDALLIVNNERLCDVYADSELSVKEAFQRADNILMDAVKRQYLPAVDKRSVKGGQSFPRFPVFVCPEMVLENDLRQVFLREGHGRAADGRAEGEDSSPQKNVRPGRFRDQRQKHQPFDPQQTVGAYDPAAAYLRVIGVKDQRFFLLPHVTQHLFRIFFVIHIILMRDGYVFCLRLRIGEIPVLGDPVLPGIYKNRNVIFFAEPVDQAVWRRCGDQNIGFYCLLLQRPDACLQIRAFSIGADRKSMISFFHFSVPRFFRTAGLPSAPVF